MSGQSNRSSEAMHSSRCNALANRPDPCKSVKSDCDGCGFKSTGCRNDEATSNDRAGRIYLRVIVIVELYVELTGTSSILELGERLRDTQLSQLMVPLHD